MRQNKTKLAVVAVCALMTGSGTILTAGTEFMQQKIDPQAVTAAQHKKTLAAFNKQVREYVKQRERVRKKLPKLSKDSTPEQIQAYQKAFVDALRVIRKGAKPGYLFSQDIANHIRTTIKTEFRGSERVELRETILEADTKGVPLQVNYPYPETKELTQIPPTLLLRLPQLPREVKYRFVGRNLLLVDTDNGLIVDYMLNALP